ncbi:site-specific integrase [Chromobacterium haemolyticum]|uniref:site-specific integrase n=1 Tax=Chromobacterium haemolyticum TaxID=394935 RepID=UPI001745DBA5|nr:site-specific integrase [Chromobacterium haemolyticum]QOD81656.1 tyrosine-type recombinase/integrase [Chromobacterium haemolyticum]
MATKRQRPSGSWEFIVRRKGVLPRPVSLTFEREEEGDNYCARLEALLDRGIVPPELLNEKPDIATIRDAIRDYLVQVAVAESDKPVLATLTGKVGEIELRTVNYSWAESWVRSMKQDAKLSPSTIRHYVGSLARCFDHLTRRPNSTFVTNPLRLLPKRYATYNDADAAVLRATAKEGKAVQVPVDEWRDRRLAPDEEKAVRSIMDGQKPEGRQRALALRWQGAIELLFELAIETGMRLREMYTLTLDQIDTERRTIFLDKTKNGDKRQVPLTSIALGALARYRLQVDAGERGMVGWKFDGGRLLPWWNGNDSPMVLKQTTALLSRQYARIFEAARCADFGFHDLRHEATSRFFERTQLSDLQIAKITGHKDPRMLSRYANLRGSDLACQLW